MKKPVLRKPRRLPATAASTASSKSQPDFKTGEESPSLTQWERGKELAIIRQTHADNPEKLRAALLAWNEIYPETLHHQDQSTTPSPRPTGPMPRDLAPKKIAPAAAGEVLSPEATPTERKLLEVNYRLDQLLAASPPPLAGSLGRPPYSEMDAWRQARAAASRDMDRQLYELNQINAQASARRIAQDHPYEIKH